MTGGGGLADDNQHVVQEDDDADDEQAERIESQQFMEGCVERPWKLAVDRRACAAFRAEEAGNSEHLVEHNEGHVGDGAAARRIGREEYRASESGLDHEDVQDHRQLDQQDDHADKQREENENLVGVLFSEHEIVGGFADGVADSEAADVGWIQVGVIGWQKPHGTVDGGHQKRDIAEAGREKCLGTRNDPRQQQDAKNCLRFKRRSLRSTTTYILPPEYLKF
jgi:hypothetical protein